MNISGAILRKHLNDQISGWIENCLKKDLEQLDALHTFNALHRVIRAVEEFISVSFHGVSDEDFDTLRVMPILSWNPYYNNLIERIVKKRFDKDVVDRYKRTALNSHMMLREFLITGDNLGYSTLMEAAAFYQAYRRHFISILFIVPSYCQGKQKLSEADLLRIAVHISKFCLVNLTSLHRQIVLSYIHKDYEALIHTNGAITGNYQFDILDKLLNEPERLSIDDPIMEEAFNMVSPSFVLMPVGKMFSLAELKNEFALIKSYFTYFNHSDLIFGLLVETVEKIISLSRDDYFITISQRKFDAIALSFGTANKSVINDYLINSSDNFIELSNSHKPFLTVGNYYKTNVNLIIRFFYNLKNVTLNKCKQFQIKAGFLFEDSVKRELAKFGFQILNVKRIKRKEFDVVTIRDGIMFNFQCKNSFIDIRMIEGNPAKFARKNNLLVGYFKRAIEKEIDREHLLTEKYGINEVRHFVISKFPVVTTEPSIVMFKDLDVFRPINI